MPIESVHPLYAANIDRWTRCRDCYDGEDTVKKAGEKYLPKADPTQTSEEYDAYRKRALFYGALARTVDGFVGAISRKPHTIDLPLAMKAFDVAATMDGTGLDEFIKKLSAETGLQGRGGVLVDFDEKAQRPYFALYSVESVTNWTADSVVLAETIYEAAPDDPYKQVEVKQLRELRLEAGIYTVTIWRKSSQIGVQAVWAPYETIVPTKRGLPLDVLPWFWFSSMGQSSEIQKPPMLGLVDVSLAHYRSSADLEHGRHFTALPTLWITGISDDSPIRVGAGAVIKLEDPAAEVGYAEFSGAGLGSIQTGMQDKELQMAMLGAAVFGGGKKGVEAAETARIRTAGESSLLMGIVSAVEETLKAALQLAARWLDATDEITIRINRDFIDRQLNPQTLVGMVQAYQAGAMDLRTFQYCLDQAEMLPPGTELDALVAALKKAGPPAAPASANPAAPVVTA